MNKEELKIYIQHCLQQIQSKLGTSKKIGNNFYLNRVNDATQWFKEIEKDIDEDLLPVSFYMILSHNIQSLKISELPDDVILEKFKEDGRNTEAAKALDDILNKRIETFCSILPERIHNYNFYKQLDFANQNTVLVGANGCGKTSLANVLQKNLNKEDGIVIPAQKLLILPTFESTPNYSQSINNNYDAYQRKVLNDKQTFSVFKENDVPYSLLKEYGEEFKHVLSTLFSERTAIRNKVCNRIRNGEEIEKEELNSNLDSVVGIWNFLIEHRVLECDESNNLVIKFGEKQYPAYQMSDGERIILYFIGRVLLAPDNALIIIDEPEVYLHKTIADKLWNILEKKRKDCVFIYLTHDLQFASSRHAKKTWIRFFSYPSHWDVEVLKENEIPEELLLKLLGSRKRVLFCEGKKNSLDKHIFEELFSNYTITPVESCKDVINYTRAFNKIRNVNSQAYGIIDRDFREQQQLNKLKKDNIFSYDVSEVENLFLIEDFIMNFAKYKHEELNFEEIKMKVLAELNKEKDIQASFYVSNKINCYFKESHVSKGTTKEEICSHYETFKNKINIETWYNERLQLIDAICLDKNYSQAIKIFNNKGLHFIVEDKLGLRRSSYKHKALDYLKNSDEAGQILRSVFPDELVS